MLKSLEKLIGYKLIFSYIYCNKGNKIKVMENKIKYLSLYDFLGKPAGRELGKKVAESASKIKLRLETREVSNPNYTGKVLLYPKDFLEAFFQEPEPIDSIIYGYVQDNDLPF